MLDKNVGSKVIFCNGQRSWLTLGGVLKCAVAAQRRYTVAEIESVIEYAATD